MVARTVLVRSTEDADSCRPSNCGGALIREVQLTQRSSMVRLPVGSRPSTVISTCMAGCSLMRNLVDRSHSLEPAWSAVLASTWPVAASSTEMVPVWPAGRSTALYLKVWNTLASSGLVGVMTLER